MADKTLLITFRRIEKRDAEIKRFENTRIFTFRNKVGYAIGIPLIVVSVYVIVQVKLQLSEEDGKEWLDQLLKSLLADISLLQVIQAATQEIIEILIYLFGKNPVFKCVVSTLIWIIEQVFV
jgi:hypothetical protein